MVSSTTREKNTIRGSIIKPNEIYIRRAIKVKMDILYSRYVELTKGNNFPALNCACCKFNTTSVKDYQRHLLLEHLESVCDENNQVHCAHCEEKFETSRDYRIHFENTHRDTSRIRRCVLCKFAVISTKGNHDKIFDCHLFNYHREKVCGIGKRYNDAIFIRRILKDYAKRNKVVCDYRDEPLKCSQNIHRETDTCIAKIDDANKDIHGLVDSLIKHREDRKCSRFRKEPEALSQQMASWVVTDVEGFQSSANELKEILCKFCTLSFSHIIDLKVHLVLVHLPVDKKRASDKISCQHCKLLFEQENTYREHLSLIHDKRGKICCPLCSFTGDKTSFAEHTNIHLPRPVPHTVALSGQLALNGDECISRSPDLLRVKVDPVKAIPPSDERIISETASKTRRLSGRGDNGEQTKKMMHKKEHLYNKETILTAVKAIKRKGCSITCPFCKCVFSNIGRNLFTHLVTAHLETERTPEGVIQCSRCIDTFKIESSYRSHFKKHNTKYIGCRQCPFKDSDRYNAINHFIDTHFKELTELSTKKALTNKISSKVFLDKEEIRCRLAEKLAITKPLKQCPFCVYTNESQRGVYNLRQHILVSHLANDRTPDGKIHCPHCHALFNSDPDFRKHLKKEQSGKGMFCPHCNYIGKTHDHLNSHIRKGHSDPLMPEILLGISSTQASCYKNPNSKKQ